MKIKILLYPIKHAFDQWIFSYRWRKRNTHNETVARSIFPIDKVKVGNYTYGELNILSYHSANEGLIIGDYCSIANDVLFVLGGEHNYRCVTNFPFFRKVFHEGIDAVSKGEIIIEDDVWIGVRCTILSGVKLGKGCVIGAGSTVTKDIPPYAVYANGKIIRYRFSDEVISKVKSINISMVSLSTLYKHKDLLHEEINEQNIDHILDQLL